VDTVVVKLSCAGHVTLEYRNAKAENHGLVDVPLSLKSRPIPFIFSTRSPKPPFAIDPRKCDRTVDSPRHPTSRSTIKGTTDETLAYNQGFEREERVYSVGGNQRGYRW